MLKRLWAQRKEEKPEPVGQEITPEQMMHMAQGVVNLVTKLTARAGRDVTVWTIVEYMEFIQGLAELQTGGVINE